MTVYRGSRSSILEPNPGILAKSDLTATWQHCRLGYGYVSYLEHCVELSQVCGVQELIFRTEI